MLVLKIKGKGFVIHVRQNIDESVKNISTVGLLIRLEM